MNKKCKIINLGFSLFLFPLLLIAKEIPSLQLVVEEPHWKELQKERDRGVKEGGLLGKSRYFPAKISLEGRPLIKAKIKLKGDYSDHYNEKTKWSFKVKLKKPVLFGLRKFSLQHPKVRNYSWEPLFYFWLGKKGILAPKYEFVKLKVNGVSWGVMAFEERPSETLAFRNQRAGGVFFKLDEGVSRSFQFKRNIKNDQSGLNVFDSFRTQFVESYGTKNLKKSKKLMRQFQRMKKELEMASLAKIPFSKVFDEDEWGKYLAAAQIWGAAHGLTWNNLRYFFNKYTAKIEPVSYDNDLSQENLSNAIANPLTQQMLIRDKNILASYLKYLKTFKKSYNQDLAMLEKEKERLNEILSPEFPKVSPPDFGLLVTRLEKFTP